MATAPIDLANYVDSRYFVRQVNRLLRKVDGYLDLTHGTSHPPFVQLMDLFGKGDIGFSVITARKDVNASVEATLDCSLYLDEGVIRVVPHWCAYKEIRASEIRDTLMSPLFRHGMIGKVFLSLAEDKAGLIALANNEKEALAQLFALSGYPTMKLKDQ
ncbi:hypothetical protein [sulfur-oxidizing endosymbiont of Gigantopelta aegis]|uniref:hypothetical protein n=1 Tax=sulfur-oxidizing endosymbiont of Gigantopelta aegis TaxID=2794934 RepID=UPI0018DC94C4|nr:hypothetical protein [sulfur-oxidizing endosymbiont of Gigantopelta aegis]